LAGGEGGAARPDNNLRGPFGGAAPLMAPRNPPPAPSDKQDKNAADAPPEKKRARRAGREGRDSADEQDGSQKEEHAEKQKDTRKVATPVSEKKRTENVPEEGTEERPPFQDRTFKDLKSVYEFTDDLFIGKLAKSRSYPLFCSCAGSEGMRRNALLSFFALFLFRCIVWLTVCMTVFFKENVILCDGTNG
jgi:hypothetical protein